jgi:hypothetical protein
LNLYSYVTDDPLSRTDLDGHFQLKPAASPCPNNNGDDCNPSPIQWCSTWNFSCKIGRWLSGKRAPTIQEQRQWLLNLCKDEQCRELERKLTDAQAERAYDCLHDPDCTDGRQQNQDQNPTLGQAANVVPKEVKEILDAAEAAKGNQGFKAASRQAAENAAKEWVGKGARNIVDRQTGQVVGQISADGTKVYRITSMGKANPYINLENLTTGGNLHVYF